MKKSILFTIIVMVGFIFLGGCNRLLMSTNVPTQKGTKTSNELTAAADSEESRLAPSSTVSPDGFLPTNTIRTHPTIVPPPEVMVFKTMPITEGIVGINMPDSDLVVAYDEAYILHFIPPTQRKLLPKGIYLDTSPDGNWIAYISESIDSPTGRLLNVFSNYLNQEFSVSLNPELLWFGNNTWLDNERLIFTMRRSGNLLGPAPMVVINPFTGEKTILSSDYPGLSLFPVGERFQFGISDVVYDPTLKIVVIPNWEQSAYVIWDRKNQEAL